MREVDASLADVDWKILAGAGSDRMDARLAAIPDVLHVLTGQGDDDVSIKFADNPNVPTTPPVQMHRRRKSESMWAAASIRLCSTCSARLAPPPSDLGDISASVTLTEVLASIFVTGVGLMSVLTLFPLGCWKCNKRCVTTAWATRKPRPPSRWPDRIWPSIWPTGATLDSVFVDLAPMPDSKIDLKLVTGREDDRIEVRSRSPGGDIDWSLDAQPGTGDDEVLVSFEHGDIDRPVILGHYSGTPAIRPRTAVRAAAAG